MRVGAMSGPARRPGHVRHRQTTRAASAPAGGAGCRPCRDSSAIAVLLLEREDRFAGVLGQASARTSARSAPQTASEGSTDPPHTRLATSSSARLLKRPVPPSLPHRRCGWRSSSSSSVLLLLLLGEDPLLLQPQAPVAGPPWCTPCLAPARSCLRSASSSSSSSKTVKLLLLRPILQSLLVFLDLLPRPWLRAPCLCNGTSTSPAGLHRIEERLQAIEILLRNRDRTCDRDSARSRRSAQGTPTTWRP